MQIEYTIIRVKEYKNCQPLKSHLAEDRCRQLSGVSNENHQYTPDNIHGKIFSASINCAASSTTTKGKAPLSFNACFPVELTVQKMMRACLMQMSAMVSEDGETGMLLTLNVEINLEERCVRTHFRNCVNS